MNPYQQKKRWKYLLLFFAAIIAAGSLLYTRYLVIGLSEAEHSRAEVWALTVKQMISSPYNDLSYYSQVQNKLSVPAIVTDAKGDIVSVRDLDSTRTFIKDIDTLPGKKHLKYDPVYFKNQLEYMKSQHDPITMTASGEQYFIYYQDSALVTQLKVFPYIQLVVIAVFLLVAYTAFSSSRKSEQNQVWVGLAKDGPSAGYTYIVINGMD
jgi:two-component system, sporulation sensor kinase D